MKWHFDASDVPPVNMLDERDSESKVSSRVLTVSEYGVKFGTYYHRSGNWSIDGIITGKKITVLCWAYIPLPTDDFMSLEVGKLDLSNDDAAFIMNIINNPPEPNDKLKAAMKRFVDNNCNVCGGTGSAGFMFTPCETCNGTGKL